MNRLKNNHLPKVQTKLINRLLLLIAVFYPFYHYSLFLCYSLALLRTSLVGTVETKVYKFVDLVYK